MGLVNPFVALVVSFGFPSLMLYKRINLGITLNATALLLALLSLNLLSIPTIIYQTTVEPLTIAVMLATFGIMLLSQLYKETKVINSLSDSVSKLINNSKIVSSLLPAAIGFLPVAGGALMSAPLVDCEADRLGLKPEKKVSDQPSTGHNCGTYWSSHSLHNHQADSCGHRHAASRISDRILGSLCTKTAK